MITIVTLLKAIKIETSEEWGKIAEITKPFEPYFDRGQKIFQSFKSAEEMEEIIKICRAKNISITVDRTDHKAAVEKRFARMSARRLVCPDCGADLEIESDENMYCEICEG